MWKKYPHHFLFQQDNCSSYNTFSVCHGCWLTNIFMQIKNNFHMFPWYGSYHVKSFILKVKLGKFYVFFYAVCVYSTHTSNFHVKPKGNCFNFLELCPQKRTYSFQFIEYVLEMARTPFHLNIHFIEYYLL